MADNFKEVHIVVRGKAWVWKRDFILDMIPEQNLMEEIMPEVWIDGSFQECSD